MLVGRDQARREIGALLAGARLGQSGVLVVRGEAGIGKSVLLEDAAARAEGLQLLRARGTESERDLPFAGLATLLQPLLGRIDALPAPQAHALGAALALREGVATDRFAVAAAVLTLVTTASEQHPVAVLVDDAHQLDPPSAQALAFVCRRLVADPVLVLAALRPADGAVWAGLPVLELERLDHQAARALLDTSAPGLTGEQAEQVLAQAQGNPLALRVLARRLPQPTGTAIPEPPTADLASVATEAFGVELARLAPPVLEALRVAAVAGDDLGLVARACAAAGIPAAALEAAEAAGLVVIGPDRLTFVHPLVRSAVYAATPAADRRRWHALVAGSLPPGDLDRRAWHRSAATLGPDERVAAELEAVGERAAARGAHAVAASAHERAARLSAGSAGTGRRLLAAGESAWLSGDDARAATVLDEALLHLDEPVLRARARAVTGLAAARGGRLSEARSVLLDAADQVAADEPGEALLLYAEAIDVCFHLLDAPGGAAAADQVERLLATSAGVPAVPAAIASIAVGMARTLEGESGAEQLRFGVDSLARHPRDERRARSAWEALGPLYLREVGAGEGIEAALAERRRASALAELPHLLFHLARDDAAGERWQRAEAAYGEAIGLARECGQSTELALNLAGLCWLHARQGREEACRALAEEARALAERNDVHLASVWTAYGLAELDLAVGRVEESVAGFAALLRDLDRLAVRDPDLSPVPEWVEGRARLGDAPDLSDPTVADYLVRAERKGLPWSLARAARVRALLAPDDGDDGADAASAAALAQHALTPDRFETARTTLLRGQRLLRQRRRADARPHLQRALDDFERLGARAWADVAIAELDATGVTITRRDTGPVTELTSRELQVALLLAGGRTTRQAATTLFLSPKTVEYHLRHVYTKLGIGSRPELVAAMRSRR